MIRDIAHNYDDTKLGIMSIAESNMELYLSFQGSNEPRDDYMAVFKAMIDTINAREGLIGKHPRNLNETSGWIMEEQKLRKDKIKNLSSDEKLVL